MSMKKIFVALDQMSLEEIHHLLKISHGEIKCIKIGLELFLKYGPTIIDELSQKFHVQIFLDLKLHDIPVTVEKSIKSLRNLPIDFLTLHLSGGRQMLEYAVSSTIEYLPKTKLLGVSFLTSLDDTNAQEIFGINLDDQAFKRLFNLAFESKVPGVVCSPHEIKLLKKNYPNLLAITPGVRFDFEINSASTGDQKRVMTPKEAFDAGADFLVMGRSLTKTNDDKHLIERIHLLNSLS
jgi:orotidine-5'-phosphate decarboxylase